MSGDTYVNPASATARNCSGNGRPFGYSGEWFNVENERCVIARDLTPRTSVPAPAGSRRARSRVGIDRLQREPRVHQQPEPAAPGLLDADRRVALVEAPLEQDQATLEVVAELGELERRVE